MWEFGIRGKKKPEMMIGVGASNFGEKLSWRLEAGKNKLGVERLWKRSEWKGDEGHVNYR